MALTPKQQRFVEEYAGAGPNSLNGTKSYRAAYPGCKTDETAKVNASRLLTKANVTDAIAALKAKQTAAVGLTAERVLLELRRLLEADPRKLYNADGTLKQVHELDDDTAATVSSIEVVEIEDDGKKVGRTLKVRQWSKPEAVKLAMKHLDLLTEKLEIVTPEAVKITVKIVDKRTGSNDRGTPEAG